MVTQRKRIRETSNPDPDSSLHYTCPVPSGKRRRAECDEDSGRLQQTFVEVHPLCEGGFGSVLAGFRVEDMLPVAIKYIPINTVVRTAEVEIQVSIVKARASFKQENRPLEVVLMQMVGTDQSVPGGTSSFSVELLDWFELQHELVLVMERPLPCSDLFDYIQERGCLQEEEAKVLLRQLVEGMIQVHTRGVLHRDLKPENILVQMGTEGPRLRLLDFGCGCLLGEGPYTKFAGTHQYIPPEYFTLGIYHAEPTTVWQIGIVLYNMLCGGSPFTNSTQIARKRLRIPGSLSRQCSGFLRRCLSKCLRRRPSLRDLLQDPWLSSTHNTHT